MSINYPFDIELEQCSCKFILGPVEKLSIYKVVLMILLILTT